MAEIVLCKRIYKIYLSSWCHVLYRLAAVKTSCAYKSTACTLQNVEQTRRSSGSCQILYAHVSGQEKTKSWFISLLACYAVNITSSCYLQTFQTCIIAYQLVTNLLHGLTMMFCILIEMVLIALEYYIYVANNPRMSWKWFFLFIFFIFWCVKFIYNLIIKLVIHIQSVL